MNKYLRCYGIYQEISEDDTTLSDNGNVEKHESRGRQESIIEDSDSSQELSNPIATVGEDSDSSQELSNPIATVGENSDTSKPSEDFLNAIVTLGKEFNTEFLIISSNHLRSFYF